MIKGVDDYLEEMKEHYPQIEEDFLLGMMKEMGTNVTSYLRTGYIGFKLASANTLIDIPDPGAKYFYISRIFSPEHLFMLVRAKKARIKKEKLKDGSK